MEEPIMNLPSGTLTVTEELVWDCTKEAFYECKHNVQTIINDRINWCMEEIERLRSLDILCGEGSEKYVKEMQHLQSLLFLEDLKKYAKEMEYLQTTVSDCMLNFFCDLETYIDKGFAWEQSNQVAIQWTGDKFIQGLFYDIFEKLNLDYSLDVVRSIMFYKPKLHTVRRVTKTLNFPGGDYEEHE